MIRSMTGYGAAEEELPDGRVLRAEIRTVNHRHLNVNVRLPRGWENLESKVTERVRTVLSRGSVSLSMACERPDHEDTGAPGLDMDRVRRLVSLLRLAGEELDFDGKLDVNTVAGLPGVWRTDALPAPPPPDEAGLLSCAEAALGGVVAMREAEGRRLEEELRRSVGRIKAEVDVIEARAPERLIRERDRLRERVALLSDAVEVDEDRLAREIAYLAEKWDIAEEIVRLRSHVTFFLEQLGDAGGGPVTAERAKRGSGAEDPDSAVVGRQAGKRLGFVVQEMNREANTLGAKANDAAISASAVAIKEELERIREQLENVE
ncbi:MAG: DUF1732 domain-containing protein [Gemmatimonadetes bacterium]|nr:DUF1732 domain-containing protein [Gemmatimonadota bacterium]